MYKVVEPVVISQDGQPLPCNLGNKYLLIALVTWAGYRPHSSSQFECSWSSKAPRWSPDSEASAVLNSYGLS